MWKVLLDRNGNKISTKILNLKNTLLNGQSFNWKIADPSLQKSNDPTHKIEYIGYIGKKVLLLKEDYINSEHKILINKDLSDEILNKEENERFIFYRFLNLPTELNSINIKEENFSLKNFPAKSENKINFEFDQNDKLDQKDEIIISDYKTPNNKNLNSLKANNYSLKHENIENLSTNFKTNSELNLALNNETDLDSLNNLILDYFQMEVDLNEILSDIAPKLPSHLGNVIKNLEGVRIIKQDVFECTLSFICSSNNNIQRIRKMLFALRENYGELVLNDALYGKIYAFPTLENLYLKTSEEKLRQLGFGYRAKYIVNSISYIKSQGLYWLYNLENIEEPWKQLILLTGVGRKVADCISLFSLKKHQTVPLDIHMIKFYNETVLKLDKKYKKIDNLNKQVYEDVSNIFTDVFGNYAGWVHSVFYLNRVDKSKPDYLKVVIEKKEEVKISKSNKLVNEKNIEKDKIKAEVIYYNDDEIVEKKLKKKKEVKSINNKYNKGKDVKKGKLKAEVNYEDKIIMNKKSKNKIKF